MGIEHHLLRKNLDLYLDIAKRTPTSHTVALFPCFVKEVCAGELSDPQFPSGVVVQNAFARGGTSGRPLLAQAKHVYRVSG